MLRIKRVVPSKGCDFHVLQTSEKAVILDTGMFHCAEDTIRSICDELGDRRPDIVLLTHTHYDHIGGIPAIREAFPDIEIFGSEYAAYVLQRQGARRVMRTLAQEAANAYLGKHAQELCYDDNLLYIDHIIGDGDVVDLGSAKLNVYSTPGHTNCSLTFYEPNDKILFLSESCGVYVDPTWIDVSILTGYEQTMRSIELCRSLGAKTLYAPHYGKITDMPPEEYFSLAESSAQAFKDIILSEWGKGRTDDEVMETCRNLIWKTKVVGYEDQPVAAFDANTKAFLSVLKKEFPM